MKRWLRRLKGRWQTFRRGRALDAAVRRDMKVLRITALDQ